MNKFVNIFTDKRLVAVVMFLIVLGFVMRFTRR